MPLDAPPDESLNLTSLETAFAAALAQDGEGDRDGDRAAQSAFVAAIWEDYRPGELPGVSAGDLGAVLARFWRFGAALKGESPTVRLSRATGAGGRDLGLDVLEIVQPDAPFLVDSVMGEVGESGAEVRAMFHPVVGAAPARESMIQVWLTPVGEERRAGLIERVLAALADVRAAVGDFSAMLALMGEAIADLIETGKAAPDLVDPETLAEDIAFLRWMDAGHFVFLGARRYDYPRDAGRRLCRRRADVRARRGPGRAARSRPAGAAAGQRAGGPGLGPALAPGGGRAGGGGQVEPAVPGAPAGLHGLCGRAPARPRRRGHRRDPVRRTVHRPGL